MRKTIVGLGMVILIFAMCIGGTGAVGTIVGGQDDRGITGYSPHPVIYSPPGQRANGMYKRNEMLWASSAAQIIQEQILQYLDQRFASSNNHYFNTYHFSIRNGQTVYLVTPFVASINNNGIKPNIRYLWMTLNLPVGVNVTRVGVFTGEATVYERSGTSVMAGTGAMKTYLIDMKSYHKMPKGIQVALTITNNKDSNQSVYSYGGKVRQEW